MAKSTQPIKWKLVEIDKSQIRPNPNNPKIRNERGFEKLAKITKKFGVIFDGILNADMSLIDGHSRLEMYPEGTGNYFIPSKQIDESDEKELNALFDVARAGDPDMFMIEENFGEEFMKEWKLKKDSVSNNSVTKKTIFGPMTPFAKKYFMYIRHNRFLPDYCNIPDSSNTRHKIRGFDGNKKKTDFTDEEKKAIIKGIKQMAKDLK